MSSVNVLFKKFLFGINKAKLHTSLRLWCQFKLLAMAFTGMWGKPCYRADGTADLLLKGLRVTLYCSHMLHNLTNTVMKKRVKNTPPKHTFCPHKSMNNELVKQTHQTLYQPYHYIKHNINPITISNTTSTLSLYQTLYQPYHCIKHHINPITISNTTSTLSLYQTPYQPSHCIKRYINHNVYRKPQP